MALQKVVDGRRSLLAGGNIAASLDILDQTIDKMRVDRHFYWLFFGLTRYPLLFFLLLAFNFNHADAVRVRDRFFLDGIAVAYDITLALSFHLGVVSHELLEDFLLVFVHIIHCNRILNQFSGLSFCHTISQTLVS